MKTRNIILVPALSLTACASHIGAYEPKRRQYVAPEAAAAPVESGTEGSLLTGRSMGASLFSDARSFGIGDLVTVRVIESASAERSAGTDVSRDSSFDAGFDALGAIESLRATNPTLDPSKLLSQSTKSAHRGGGTTERKDRIAFVVTASVKQVLPNGNLFIEGDRVVQVNEEEHHFYISGVARPTDVGNDNSIPSTLLAEAEVEFIGKGVLTNKSRQGWLTTVLDWIWPF